MQRAERAGVYAEVIIQILGACQRGIKVDYGEAIGELVCKGGGLGGSATARAARRRADFAECEGYRVGGPNTGGAVVYDLLRAVIEGYVELFCGEDAGVARDGSEVDGGIGERREAPGSGDRSIPGVAGLCGDGEVRSGHGGGLELEY